MWGNGGVKFGRLTIVVVVLWPIFDAKTPFLGVTLLPGGGGGVGGLEALPNSIRAHGKGIGCARMSLSAPYCAPGWSCPQSPVPSPASYMLLCHLAELDIRSLKSLLGPTAQCFGIPMTDFQSPGWPSSQGPCQFLIFFFQNSPSRIPTLGGSGEK